MRISKAFQNKKVAECLLNSKVRSGPFDGGCLIVAKSLQKLFGKGKIVRMESDYQWEHYGLQIGNHFFDGYGKARSAIEWKKRFATKEDIDDAIDWEIKAGIHPETHTIDDPETIEKLTALLREILMPKPIQLDT